MFVMGGHSSFPTSTSISSIVFLKESADQRADGLALSRIEYAIHFLRD